MSYSRWSNSSWYTFWSSTPENTPMEDQEFCVDCELHFSYKSLKKDMDKCINNVRSHYEFKMDEDNENRPSDAEYDELKGYMLEFIQDVEKEFKDK